MILRLQVCLNELEFPGVQLSNSNKTNIQALKDAIQHQIDQIITRREWLVGLVKQIPDLEAQLVLQFRYGLFGFSTTKTPWNDMPDKMHYEMETIFRRHRAGLEYLNELLEKGGENRC